MVAWAGGSGGASGRSRHRPRPWPSRRPGSREVRPVAPTPRDPTDDPAPPAAAFSGAYPQHPDVASAVGEDLHDLTAPAEADSAFARTAAEDVVAVVRALVAADPSAVRTATTTVTSRLTAATTDDQALAAVVALAPLSERLPLLSGVTESVHDDPVARDLLLTYAELLAGRAEALRARLLPDVTVAQVRLAGHVACGLPDHDPALAGLVDRPPVDLLLAACVLLAQTCADGAPGPEALRAEIAEAFPASAP